MQASELDEALAIELIARFTGNSRGTPIAKKSFVDGVLWERGRMAAVGNSAVGKGVSDGLCDFIEGQKCDCKIGDYCKGRQ